MPYVDQKRTLNPPKMEFEAVVSHTMCMLGTEFGSPGRATSILFNFLFSVSTVTHFIGALQAI